MRASRAMIRCVKCVAARRRGRLRVLLARACLVRRGRIDDCGLTALGATQRPEARDAEDELQKDEEVHEQCCPA